MAQTKETKNLATIILSAVLVCAIMPYLLSFVGMDFGPASRGGAGAHFAGLPVGDYVVRFDVPTLGLLAFLAFLGGIYYRVVPNRFVTLMAFSLLAGGLGQAIQIIPLAQNSFATQVVVSTTWGHLGFALIVLAGALQFRFSKRNLGLLTPTAGTLLLVTWVAMAENPAAFSHWAKQIQILTIGLLLLSALALRPPRTTKTLHFFRMGILALIIPHISGLLWLHNSDQTVFHQGFHVAALLWWMAILLPVLGLGIDYIFAFYGQGMAREKRFLRQVIDAIPHFIFARDDQGRFTLVNRAVAEFYGKSVEDIEGQYLSEIHADRDQAERWLEEDQAALADGKITSIDEDEARDVNGEPIWIDAIKTPLTGQNVTVPQVLGISIDITPQKKAEMALARRLRFELTYTSVLRQLLNCTVDNMGNQMSEILGEVAQFAQADRCAVYRQDDDHRPLFRWPGEETPGPGSPNILTIPIMQGSEEFGHLLLNTAQPRTWTQDETTLLQNIADLFITVWSKIEAEKKLTETMEKARASSRAKSEFLANMSHEIRTPMNCVIGITELLGDMDPTPSQRQYLDMISQSGNSLLALINDILDLSKIEAGQLELDPVKVNLREMVEEVVGLIAFNAQAKGLEMVCRYAPGAPDVVVCDPNRLRQVLTNLLNNAYKFTRTGHIYLNVEPVGQRDGGLDMNFQVTDTGIGIPAPQLEKIFDKFTQADTSTTRRFGGTGLGLSISRQLVHLMGGELEVDSVDGKGSTFAFTIPVEEVPGTLQAPAPVDETDTAILVVSNHELGCEVLAEQVRHLGYSCSTALGCQQGLKKLDELAMGSGQKLSYILVDQDVLPEDTPLLMDFLDRLPPETRPNSVLLSSLSSMAREKDFVRSGFTSTLTKPVRPQHLAQVLAGEKLFEVPAHSPPAEVGEAELPIPRSEGPSPVILLAEDNPFNQKVATGMLKILGCEVDVANNGIEALDLVRRNNYAVVFMDCQMPEMDGYEATERIRQLEGPRQSTTIIAMTANALSGDRQACFDVGMDDFLSKPITKAMLSDMLSKWEVLGQPVGQ